MSAEILQAALDYAEAGFAVFPVKRSDKNPYTIHGVKDATTDTAQIRQWWDQWPAANVAIAMGKPSGNVFVIDVDIKPEDNKHGDESLLKWEAACGDFPNTVRAVTGSGGLHYFYHLDGVDQYKNTIDALPGIDIRGDGAYIVAAPSVYEDGRVYRWDNEVSILDDEIAEANESVIELLSLNKRNVKPDDPNYKKLNVANIEKGDRNNTIFKYAASQCGLGVPFEIALTAARELNESWPNPLDDAEVQKAVTSGYKYEPNEITIYTPKEEKFTEQDLDIPTLEMFEEQDVEWLIRDYLPKGQITMICGTGGTGKTSVWVSLLSSISSGEPTLFDGFNTDLRDHAEPKTVMFFSSEDTVENVIKKRLRRHGANMRNIRTISLSDQRFDRIKFGSSYLGKLIEKYKPVLCVFDPLQAFVDGKIKMSDRNAMRQAMRCLIEWGDKYGTTFLIVMHTNKQLNVWGRNRMADSADLWDIARCVWMVGDTDQDGIKYLSHEKSNYGKTGQTLLFTNDGGMPVFRGWSDKKDRDFVISAAKLRNSEGSTNIADACNFILSTLEDYPEGMQAKDLTELMEDTGFKPWGIKQAKSELKNSKKIAYFKTEMKGNWKVKKV